MIILKIFNALIQAVTCILLSQKLSHLQFCMYMIYIYM